MIKDMAVLIQAMCRFTAFVQEKDHKKDGFISFRDSSGFLGFEEDYKVGIAEAARTELHYKEWKEDWIGTGKIAKYASNAMSKASNLVFKNQQVNFKNRLNPERPEYNPKAEEILYHIFRGNDDEKAFTEALSVFGHKYDTIAFLFFVKDGTRYLPISPGNFDQSFAALNIDFKTAFNCSWENYTTFLSLVSEISNIMDAVMPLQAKTRLIDAHSFLWVLHEPKYINWIPDLELEQKIEQNAEDCILGHVDRSAKKKTVVTQAYQRSAEVVKATRKRANGVCQFCKKPAPFIDKKGNPYLEVHHVVWLSRGGKDSINNTVALCPNCHTRMHIVDNPADVELLLFQLQPSENM